MEVTCFCKGRTSVLPSSRGGIVLACIWESCRGVVAVVESTWSTEERRLPLGRCPQDFNKDLRFKVARPPDVIPIISESPSGVEDAVTTPSSRSNWLLSSTSNSVLPCRLTAMTSGWQCEPTMLLILMCFPTENVCKGAPESTLQVRTSSPLEADTRIESQFAKARD